MNESGVFDLDFSNQEHLDFMYRYLAWLRLTSPELFTKEGNLKYE